MDVRNHTTTNVIHKREDEEFRQRVLEQNKVEDEVYQIQRALENLKDKVLSSGPYICHRLVSIIIVYFLLELYSYHTPTSFLVFVANHSRWQLSVVKTFCSFIESLRNLYLQTEISAQTHEDLTIKIRSFLEWTDPLPELKDLRPRLTTLKQELAQIITKNIPAGNMQ